jgi:putative ABC transport system substrate-binding protein
MIRRREFIAGLGGTAAWPVAARAQQGMRRVGVMVEFDERDSRSFLDQFTRAFEQLGWIEGRNVRIDFRWTASDPERIRALAKEIVGLKPDVILVGSTPGTAAVRRETQMIRTLGVPFLRHSQSKALGSRAVRLRQRDLLRPKRERNLPNVGSAGWVNFG